MQFGGPVTSFAVAVTAIAVWEHRPAGLIGGAGRRRVLLGLVLGVGALGSMLAPDGVAPPVHVDMQMALITAAGLVGGPISAVVGVICPLLYRLVLGGSGMPADCASSLLAMAIGTLSHIWMRDRAPKARYLAVTAACVALCSVPHLSKIGGQLQTTAAGVLPLVALTFGATLLFAWSLLRDERHRTLIRRNETYRAIIETLPDSLNAKDREGRFVAVNPATVRLMQVATADDLIGKSDFDFYPKKMARSFRQQERKVLDNVVVGPLEERISLPNGAECWLATMKTPMLDGDGKVVGIVTHNRDITKQKRLENELDRSQALVKAAVTQMADGLVLYDADGILRFCNQQYRDLFPKTADLRVPGGSFVDIIRAAVMRGEEKSKPDIEAWIAERKAALTTPGDRSIRLEDGREIEARSRLMDDGGVLVTFSDVTDVRRKESEARESNRLLLMAEEIAHVGHWRYDVVANVSTWSDEVFRIHGLEPGATAPPIEGAIDFYHPDDRSEVQRCVFDAIAHQRNFDATCRLIRPTGEWRYVHSRGVCEIDPLSRQVVGLFGTLVDVSETTQIQLQLSEKSADLQTTLDSMDQGLIRISADRTIELANRRFAELLELPPALTAHRGWTIETIQDYLAARGDIDHSSVDTDASGAPAVSILECSMGRIIEVRTRPLPDGSELRTYNDITARRKDERALQASEAQYRMLADATSDIITQLNPDLSRRYVSPACRRLLGYEPEEMLALPPEKVIHPDDFAEARRLMEQVIAGQIAEDKVTTTYRMRHLSGHWVWVEAAINLVRDPASGQPEALLLSLRDATVRRETARQLELAKVAAENVARLKSEFMANMSHELRTPLTGILGMHDLLDRDQRLNSEQKRQVGMARDAGRSLLRIVNDILDFSKIEADLLTIETVPFRVADVIEACRGLGQAEARRKPLRVGASLRGVPDMLAGDPARLRQVILNLTTNAVKFTERGRVSLLVTYDQRERRLRVEVSDTGIGIAEDKLALLFGRFSQTDASITRRYGGTGLGLAISKRLITLMGGEIGVSSDVGHGSTFWFEVPLSEPSDQLNAGGEVGTAPGSATFSVLLAEDNEVNQEIIMSMLEQRGHRVVAVENGLKAIEALCNDPGIEVVLMDLQMPVMDGLTATRSIRAAERAEHRTSVPIIGLTANAMIEDVQRCLEAGMHAHVAKPIEWADLFATMDHVVLWRSASGCAVSAPNPLLNAKLDHLGRVIGDERVAALLTTFALGLEQLNVDLDGLAEPELSARCSDLASMAGQLGFLELSILGTAFGQEARRSQAPPTVRELKDCIASALAAARAYTHRTEAERAEPHVHRAADQR